MSRRLRRVLPPGGRGRIGAALFLFVIAVAAIGPFVAPHDPNAIVGVPGSPPGNGLVFGADSVGRDVLSRVLNGGWTILLMAMFTTFATFTIGVPIGMYAAAARSRVGGLLMRGVDLALIFPALLVFLLLAAGLGTGAVVLLVGITIVQAPSVARIAYSATRTVIVRAHVEAATLRGESRLSIMRRELFPGIRSILLANLGLTVTISVLLIAAANFLQLGLQPPKADWALMINENRPIQQTNIWSMLVPLVLLAALTVSVNLIADAVARGLGSRESEDAYEQLELDAAVETTRA